MRVKTFEASDIQEALRRVKLEMGPGAVIVSTRHVRRGGAPFGIFGKPHVEITAALPSGSDPSGSEDDDRPSAGGNGRPLLSAAASRLIAGPEPPEPEAVAATRPEGAAGLTVCPAAEQMAQTVEDLRSMLDARARQSAADAGGLDELRWEMEELRWTVNTALERLDPLKGRGAPDSLSRLYKRLRLQGVRQDLALHLLEAAKEGLDKREMRDAKTLEKFVEDRMVSMLAPPPKSSGSAKRRVVALIGSPGCGKTTTLAKLAADAALNKRKRVALVSMDTYRIGAVEQLRIYSKIMGIPLTIVADPRELADAVAQNEEADFIFIDTTGRSPRDPEQKTELRDYLKGVRGLETHLVLNATAKDRDLWETIRRFWSVPFHALLFTRLDETSAYGTVFNQAVRSRKAVSYLSAGQKVPEDLEAATPRRLARMILTQ